MAGPRLGIHRKVGGEKHKRGPLVALTTVSAIQKKKRSIYQDRAFARARALETHPLDANSHASRPKPAPGTSTDTPARSRSSIVVRR